MKCEILSQCRCKRQKNVPDVLAKVFKINTHSWLRNESKCYSSGTHPLKFLGSDKFYTGQTDNTTKGYAFPVHIVKVCSGSRGKATL